MSDLKPESLLHERYRIIRTLGKGGMGMVYLAEDSSLKRQVAVKENFGMGEESAGQFLQEAHLLAALHHSNLPRVTDYFIESPYQYLVMDYLPGDDLQTLIEREGRQTLERVLPWIEQLGDALTYMHSQNPPVTHRDIKPANIKLRADGTAVLVDFGIAKAAESAQKTAAGAMGFTPGFAPPEQAGGGRTGPYSDQYALAATLYNLITGRRPPDSIKRVLEGTPLEPASRLSSEIPVNVSEALDHALTIHPEERFASVQDFLAALHDPSYRWTVDLRKTPREKRPAWFYPAIGLIVLLVIAILGVSAVAYFKLASPTAQPSITPMAFLSNTPSASRTMELKAGLTSTIEAPATAVVIATVEPTAQPSSTQSLLAGGKWLAFSSNREDGKTLQIWLAQIGLSTEGKPAAVNARQVTHGDGDKIQAAWSPDGEFILFSAKAKESSVNRLDIWKIPAGGGEPIDLTNRKGDDMFPCWSPDGKLINFTSDSREDGILQLYAMDPDGGNQTRISRDYDESQGIWTPDMQTLLYVITASDNHYFFQRQQKFEFKTPQPYDPNEVFGRLGQVSDPALSTDGSKLAYTRSKGRDRKIGVAEFQSRGASFSLITKTGLDYDPAWSVDGKWIAFTSERDGKPQVYVMTSAGLIQTNISPQSAVEEYPAWQP